jgi:hypothetical protein
MQRCLRLPTTLRVLLPIFLKRTLWAIISVVVGDDPMRFPVRESNRDALSDKLHALARVSFRCVMESGIHVRSSGYGHCVRRSSSDTRRRNSVTRPRPYGRPTLTSSPSSRVISSCSRQTFSCAPARRRQRCRRAAPEYHSPADNDRGQRCNPATGKADRYHSRSYLFPFPSATVVVRLAPATLRSDFFPASALSRYSLFSASLRPDSYAARLSKNRCSRDFGVTCRASERSYPLVCRAQQPHAP